MNWLQKVAAFLGTPRLTPGRYTPQFSVHDETSLTDIYRSRDFPWVFLGSADLDDLVTVERITGKPICFRFDLTDKDTSKLPAPSVKVPFHEPKVWSNDFYNQTQQLFNQTADRLVSVIRARRCPIYVHCSGGINRSVSILAAALTKLTNRSLNDILREMKSYRGVISPDDPYYLLALEYSPNDSVYDKQLIHRELETPDDETQSAQVTPQEV